MSIDYFYAELSPPCQSVRLAAAALGVELNLKLINYVADEHKSPEYLKMNPEHMIPTIKDGDFVLWESRPIMGYLVNKYGKDDSLYPKDPVKRARVDQKLYFDMGTLYQRFSDYYYPQVVTKAPADPEKYAKAEDGVGLFNTALEGQKYAAGDQMTIADFALFVTVACFEAVKFPLEKYPNVKRWFDDLKATVPGYDKILPGLEGFKKFMENL